MLRPRGKQPHGGITLAPHTRPDVSQIWHITGRTQPAIVKAPCGLDRRSEPCNIRRRRHSDGVQSPENRKVGGSTPPLATESAQVRGLMNVERPGSSTRASHNLSQTVLGDRWASQDAVEGGHGGDGVGVLGVGVDPLGDHGVVSVDARYDVDRDPGVQEQRDAGVAEVV